MEEIYPDFVTKFYDVVYDKLRSHIDHEFYLKKILNTEGSILEVGAGTGRLFFDALKNGADIYGIDKSQNMLIELKKKLDTKDYFRIEQADVQDFNLNKKFKLIIAPFRVFSHLICINDQLLALQRIYEHLEDNGKFIFDVYMPDPRLILEQNGNNIDFDGEWKPNKKLQRIVSIEPNYSEQFNLVTMKFIWQDEGREYEKSWSFKMRYFFRYELEHLLARAKFNLVNIFGSFNEDPLSNSSKDFVLICSKSKNGNL